MSPNCQCKNSDTGNDADDDEEFEHGGGMITKLFNAVAHLLDRDRLTRAHIGIKNW